MAMPTPKYKIMQNSPAAVSILCAVRDVANSVSAIRCPARMRDSHIEKPRIMFDITILFIVDEFVFLLCELQSAYTIVISARITIKGIRIPARRGSK